MGIFLSDLHSMIICHTFPFHHASSLKVNMERVLSRLGNPKITSSTTMWKIKGDGLAKLYFRYHNLLGGKGKQERHRWGRELIACHESKS